MGGEVVVLLCALKMQECLKGETPCPYQPVLMGEDYSMVVENAEACEYAGRPLPPFYYRGLVGVERKRHGGYLSALALKGEVKKA